MAGQQPHAGAFDQQADHRPPVVAAQAFAAGVAAREPVVDDARGAGPGRQRDQRQARQQFGRHARRAVERGRRRGPAEFGLADGRGGDAGPRRTAGDHGEIQFAVGHALLQHLADVHIGFEHQLRVGAAHAPDQARQPGQRAQFAHAEAAASAQARALRQRGAHPLGRGQQFAGLRQQALAGVGQHRLVAAAVEQRLAQRLFEFGDALGQRRHRQMQALGRHGETCAGGGPVEGFELLEGHARIVEARSARATRGITRFWASAGARRTGGCRWRRGACARRAATYRP